MREITFKSLVGQADVDVPGIGNFKNGQSRQVTDEQAEFLLRNVNFVEEGAEPESPVAHSEEPQTPSSNEEHA